MRNKKCSEDENPSPGGHSYLPLIFWLSPPNSEERRISSAHDWRVLLEQPASLALRALTGKEHGCRAQSHGQLQGGVNCRPCLQRQLPVGFVGSGPVNRTTEEQAKPWVSLWRRWENLKFFVQCNASEAMWTAWWPRACDLMLSLLAFTAPALTLMTCHCYISTGCFSCQSDIWNHSGGM